jgi:glucokinase
LRKRFNVGVDLGGTNIKIAVVDFFGNVLYSDCIPTEAHKGYGHTINNIIKSIENILEKNNLSLNEIDGVGIGCPGQVDPENGMVKFLPNIPGWINVPLTEIIENEIGLKAGVDNDVRCAALGEYYFGAGKGVKNLVCITVGTGIGSGIIIDGKLVRGANSSAGEIGHMILQEHGGLLCGCGGTGCFETLASGPAIVEMAEKYIMGGKSSKFRELAEGGQITPEIVSRAANFGDEVAKTIFKTAGYWIGIALVNVVNLLNPEMIIIGGGVAEAGNLLVDPVRNTIREKALKTASENLTVVEAKLGNNAGVIGASLLFCQNDSELKPCFV